MGDLGCSLGTCLIWNHSNPGFCWPSHTKAIFSHVLGVTSEVQGGQKSTASVFSRSNPNTPTPHLAPCSI